jgi:two-component system nitrate/nitrite sensor histidine kinase NarX
MQTIPSKADCRPLRWLVDEFQSKSGIQVELILADGQPATALAPTVEVQLLRIIQEALTNIRKHARAQHVRVSLQSGPASVEVTIEDDGVGFEPDVPAGDGRTFGLRIMRERGKEIGGVLEVSSAPGRGTYIRVQAPGSLTQEIIG